MGNLRITITAFLALLTGLVDVHAQSPNEVTSPKNGRTPISARALSFQKLKQDHPNFFIFRDPNIEQGKSNFQNAKLPMFGVEENTAAPLKPQKAQGISSAKLWATVYSNPVNNVLGLYSFTTTNPSVIELLSSENFNYTTFRNGVQYKDRAIYGSYFQAADTSIIISKYDLDTKAVTTKKIAAPDFSYWIIETAQGVDGTVYGEIMNPTGNGMTFGTIDFSADGLPKIQRTFGSTTRAYVALGITSDGRLYGIGQNGFLYLIDKATGKETSVGRTGLSLINSSNQLYYQSGEIDPVTDTFYWLAVDANGASGLYTVNLSNGRATKISDVGGRFAQGMLIPNIANDGAPAMVDTAYIQRENFKDNSGILSFTAPAKAFDNRSTLSGQLTYKLYDETYKDTKDSIVTTGQTTPGAKVQQSVTIAAKGLHRFALTVSNENGESPRYRFSIVVGSDIPLPVSNLKAVRDNDNKQKVNITWDAPDVLGTNGATIDTANLVYDIARTVGNKTETIAKNVKATSYTDVIPDGVIRSYTYGVTAKVDDLTSETVWTGDGVLVGHAVDGNYWKTDFNNGDFETFVIIDGNKDGNKWNRIRRGVRFDPIEASNENYGNDDWVITPPIKFDSKYIYKLRFHSCNGISNSATNTMEVMLGKDNAFVKDSAKAMTTVVKPSFYLPEDYDFFESEINPDMDDNYRIGFHINSPAIRSNAYLDTIYVQRLASKEGPDSVSAFNVKPGEEGALSSTLSFIVASKRINGESFAKVDSLNITRNGKQIASLKNLEAGQNVTYIDKTVPSNGFYTYNVTAYLGENKGRTNSTTLFVGKDVPVAPEDVTLSDNVDNILAKWKPYETGLNGINGGYINKDSVNVSFFVYQNASRVGKFVKASDYGATSTTIPQNPEVNVTDPSSSTQELYYLAARAESKQGASSHVQTGSVVVGPSIIIPYKESFKGALIDNGFAWSEGNEQYNGSSTAAGWNHTGSLSQDADGGCALWAPYTEESWMGEIPYTITPGDEVSFNTPKIKLNGAAHPKLYFYIHTIPNEQASLKVLVGKPDGQNEEVASYDLSTYSNGWTLKSIDLAKYAAERYIFIKFLGVATGSNVSVAIDNINVFDQFADNIKATGISTPKSIKAGKIGNVNVEVENFGANTASNFDVVLYADGQAVDTVTVNDKLGVLGTKTLSLKLPVGVDKKNVSVKGQVYYAKDMNAADDTTATKSVTVLPSVYTKVNDLSASAEATGINLKWTKPVTKETIEVTEDFENYEAFATEFGDWTLFDGDKGLTYPLFSKYAYPGQGTAFAFDVFNPNAITKAFVVTESNVGLTPHSGQQYAAALYAEGSDGYTTNANNWLISPELSGNKQTVSFYALNLYSSSLRSVEKFDILYSTQGTDTADFKKITSDVANGTNRLTRGVNWKQVSVEIPAGAKYFAIHHNTDDKNSYMFGVDDISFERASLGLDDSIISYNIYRDGVLVGNVKGNTCTFTDGSVDEGQHVYNVTVVYQSKQGDVNESGFSNNASITVTGINGVETDSLGLYNVYTIDGKAVRLGAKSLKGLSNGVYIINDKKYIIR